MPDSTATALAALDGTTVGAQLAERLADDPTGDLAASLREILDQEHAVRAALEAVEAAGPAALDHLGDEPLVLTGAGSPLHLCRSAATAISRDSGRRAIAVPASELALEPELHLGRGSRPVLVAVSRSGESGEVLDAAERIRDLGGRVVAVTAAPASRLARAADEAVLIQGVDEVGLTQTCSFTAMLVATLALGARARPEGALARAVAELPSRWRPLAPDALRALATAVAEPLERVVFLGSAELAGLAHEGALKALEMSGVSAMAFEVLEFRHGPQVMSGPGLLAVGLLAPGREHVEAPVLAEIARRGGGVVAVGAPPGLPGVAHIAVDGRSTAVQLPPYLPPMQILGFLLGIARGRHPAFPEGVQRFVGDRPSHHTPATGGNLA
jgi:glutamine---fructose-6-phosphate transaminase (isomerizing)